MNRKRVIIIIVLVVVVIFGLITAFKFLKREGDTSNVKLVLDNSSIFSKSDIKSAIKVIYDDFKKYPASMEILTYDEKKCKYMSSEYKNKYKASDVIVFYSDFTTYSGNVSSFNDFYPNQRYSDWVWILTRNKGESWVLREWGY